MPTVLNQLSIEYGGTGSPTASGARENLGINGLLGSADPNPIRNPVMQIAQRGTGIAAANGQYQIDGWKTDFNAGAATINQSTDAPDVDNDGAPYYIPNSLHVDVTTAVASPASSNYFIVRQSIEGNLWKKVHNIPCYVSFWVKSSTIGRYYLCFQSSAVTQYSISLPYDIEVADKWERKIIAVPASPALAGYSGMDTDVAVYCDFQLMPSDDYAWTTHNAWTAGGTHGGYDQTNLFASTSNEFFVTDVRLVPGTANVNAPPRDFHNELMLCQRYYQKSFPYTTVPAVGNHTFVGCAVTHVDVAGQQPISHVRLTTYMRTTPSCTLYREKSTGTYSASFSNGALEDNNNASVAYASENCITIFGSSGTSAANYYIQWVANAEL